MELRLSNLAKTYPASGIRKMFDLAAGYDDVIALTLGEPNFEPPAYVKEAAKKALDENYTHYAPNAGLPVLREALSAACLVSASSRSSSRTRPAFSDASARS